LSENVTKLTPQEAQKGEQPEGQKKKKKKKKMRKALESIWERSATSRQ